MQLSSSPARLATIAHSFLYGIPRRWLLCIFLNAIYITRHTILGDALTATSQHSLSFHHRQTSQIQNNCECKRIICSRAKEENQRLWSRAACWPFHFMLSACFGMENAVCPKCVYTWKHVESVQLKEKQRHFPQSHTKSVDLKWFRCGSGGYNSDSIKFELDPDASGTTIHILNGLTVVSYFRHCFASKMTWIEKCPCQF